MARCEYEMSEADLKGLLDAMKPVPYMIVGGMRPVSQQENANAAWKSLGDRMGFDHMTVRPAGKGDRFFSAEPLQTDRTALLAGTPPSGAETQVKVDG